MLKDIKMLGQLANSFLLVFLLIFVTSCSHKEKNPVSKTPPNKEQTSQVITQEPTADDIIAYAKRFIGTPYYYGGTTTKTGFDCSGFVNHVYKGVYGKSPLPRASNQMVKLGIRVSKSRLKKGDLVFFNTLGRPYSHVGIYVGDGKFIHSSTSKGVIISSLDNVYYKPRYETARRIDVDKL